MGSNVNEHTIRSFVVQHIITKKRREGQQIRHSVVHPQHTQDALHERLVVDLSLNPAVACMREMQSTATKIPWQQNIKTLRLCTDSNRILYRPKALNGHSVQTTREFMKMKIGVSSAVFPTAPAPLIATKLEILLFFERLIPHLPIK